MGTTTLEGGASVCHLETESGTDGPDGCHADNIYGSYLHGIFDSREFAQSLVEALMQAKGLDASDVHAVDMREYKEQQYDKLAQVIRDNMDMELVYRILDEGVR